MRVFGLVRILGWQFYVGAEDIWVAVLAWGISDADILAGEDIWVAVLGQG
jgi:hypothetical protein